MFFLFHLLCFSPCGSICEVVKTAWKVTPQCFALCWSCSKTAREEKTQMNKNILSKQDKNIINLHYLNNEYQSNIYIYKTLQWYAAYHKPTHWKEFEQLSECSRRIINYVIPPVKVQAYVQPHRVLRWLSRMKIVKIQTNTSPFWHVTDMTL